MSSTFLLVSVRPEYAEGILSGNKTAELRRTRPRVVQGDRMFVYVSSPVKKLTGVCVVTQLISGSPEKIWDCVSNICGLTREDYNSYYSGCEVAFAILVKDAKHLPKPINLSCLREELGSFFPPQIYRYLSSSEVERVESLANCSCRV
jgi:predicted transcriptional regulator